MSGKSGGLSGPSYKQPALPKRPDITKMPSASENILPTRSEIRVFIKLKDFEPLARVSLKMLVAGTPSLVLQLSDYIRDIDVAQEKKHRQAQQCLLHEFMHTALWDDITITHSQDEKSLLYYYVRGDNLEPTTWDLAQMKAAASRIGHINFILGDLSSRYSIWNIFLETVFLWNKWLGRDFFKIL